MNKFKSEKNSILNKLKQSLISHKKIFLLLLPALFILVFTAVFLFLNKDIVTVNNSGSKDVVKNQGQPKEEEKEDPNRKSEENPINGNMITKAKLEELKNKKAFAVTVNNHPEGRPHIGLSQADMVMEVLTEYSITRYVGVFYEKEPEKIGPVRSVRRYMLDFIAEFDSPVLLHEGWATFNKEDKVYVRETDARRDIYEFKVKSMQTLPSRYRDKERLKTYEYVHTLFTSYELIQKEFDAIHKKMNWERESNIQALKFKDELPLEGRGPKKRVDMTFAPNGKNYSHMGFVYNPETNSYDRILNEKEDFDALNGQRISPKVVLVEWHNYKYANDNYLRIVENMIGEGEVHILQDGQVIDGVWKKKTREDRTRYYTKEGEEIALNRGQLWKVVLNQEKGKKISTINFKDL